MIDKIYVVYKGKIVEAKVVRETAKSVYVNRCEGLVWQRRLDKCTVHVTQKDAVEAEINTVLADVDMCVVRLKIFQARLKVARVLLEDLLND